MMKTLIEINLNEKIMKETAKEAIIIVKLTKEFILSYESQTLVVSTITTDY